MLDGRVRWIKTLEAEVYDLADTDGPRGRGEASIIGGRLEPDPEGVIAEFRGRRLLIPTAVIRAASRIAGRDG